MNVSPYAAKVSAIQQSHNNSAPSTEKTSAQSFREFMEKTPEEMQFESFLKKNDLTREEFEKLPQEQKEKLLKEFKEEMKRKVGLVG